MGCVAGTTNHQRTAHRENNTKPMQSSANFGNYPAQYHPHPPIFSKPAQPAPTAPNFEIAMSTQEIELRVVAVEIDSNCPMLSSYVVKDKTAFWKQGYNWHSLPIKSRIDLKTPSVFSVKNSGIKFNHFVLGLIMQSDLQKQTFTPWRTEGVVCYESCAKKQGSWMRHGEGLKQPKREVRNGQTLSAVIRQRKIQFWINREFQGKMDIPMMLAQAPLLPYVAVFCSGDSFEILTINPLKPYWPPL